MAPPVASTSTTQAKITTSRVQPVASSSKAPPTPQPLKRKASAAEMTTPQKPRQARQIPHASPTNPFLATGPGLDSMDPSSASKFLYAASPQKLRHALSITPRTRARKRLRGEDVGETPVKERVGKRSWVTSSKHSEDEDEDEEDEDEVLGPSPAKPALGTGFKPLFAAEIKGLGKGAVNDDLPFGPQRKTSMFGKPPTSIPSSRVMTPSPSPSPPPSPTIETLPEPSTPPPIEEDESEEEDVSPVRTKRITLDDGEQTELIIRPTRDVGRWRPPRTPTPPPDDEGDVELEVPPSLLGTLSLRSPMPASASRRRLDKKVQAIFAGAPPAAKAVDKEKLAEEQVEESEGNTDEEDADDDWESEVEGWKVGGPGEVLSDEGW